MKRMIIAVLVLVMLCSGCTAKKESKPILTDVVSAYDIDKEGREMVASLTSDLEDTFEALVEKGEPDDNDYIEYAGKVADLLTDFYKEFDWNLDSLSDKIQNADSKEESNKLTRILIDGYNFENGLSELKDEVKDAFSGERCIEAAVNAVDSYAMLFYGEPIITEEDLVKLGWD